MEKSFKKSIKKKKQCISFIKLIYIIKVLPSPCVTGYRNKCEFSIAKGTVGEDKGLSCVGFVKGRMIEKEYSIMKIDNCINLTKNTIKIVQHFQEFIRNFSNFFSFLKIYKLFV